jgi:hypothetical protein
MDTKTGEIMSPELREGLKELTQKEAEELVPLHLEERLKKHALDCDLDEDCLCPDEVREETLEGSGESVPHHFKTVEELKAEAEAGGHPVHVGLDLGAGPIFEGDSDDELPSPAEPPEVEKKAEEQPKIIKMTPAPHRKKLRKKLRGKTKKVPNPKMPDGWGLEVIPGKFEEVFEEVPGFRPEPDERGRERMAAAERKRERRREKARKIAERQG